MGDVCISFLLCDDLPLAHHLRMWRAQKQQRLGYSGEQRTDYSANLCVSFGPLEHFYYGVERGALKLYPYMHSCTLKHALKKSGNLQYFQGSISTI